MKCDCKPCDCHYPLETFLGQMSSAGAFMPLKDATIICGRCKQNISCRKCRSEDE